MSPTHHPHEEALLAYATGAMSEAEALQLACHLTLCPVCRHRVVGLEAVGGELLDELPAAEVDSASFDAVMAALDGPDEPVRPVADGVLPQALFDRVGPAADLPWKWSAPGIKQVDVPVAADFPVRLFLLSPGMKIPEHEHTGTERTLVLSGGFTDDDGHYGRGDLAVHGENYLHRQRIDPGEPCIAFVVNDGPLVPTSVVGRAFQWLTGT